ncbi:hypothetical protein DDE20_06670 [Pararhodobacter oceanensis]|uniref:YjiS-like domain-containing protein n=2 Tax=Pararhodobacter oceanensis TaxID=2172121 RepID=A0A2T8HX33_9RHOB|nr:hypothetical protein DDE20_06670 [Pararhodobacter oceanensis]
MPRASLLAMIAGRAPKPALQTMIATARERRQLAALPEQRLEDLGLTRAEATLEAARPFWDAPRAWRR